MNNIKSTTCIVGYVDEKTGDIYMGGDSERVSRYNSITSNEKKVFVKDKIILGCTGYVTLLQALKYSFTIPERNKEDSNTYVKSVLVKSIKKCLEGDNLAKKEHNIVSFEGTILIGYDKCLYQITGDFGCVSISDNYYSIGCGGDYAKGALFTLRGANLTSKQKITKALEAADKFSVGVSKPFHILRLKK